MLRFENKEKYQEWLRWQSYNVRKKAKRFAEVYGDILPIVLVVEADSSQTGEWAEAHIFIHPQVQELLKAAIWGD